MKRSLCALLALTGVAQAGEAQNAGFFQPAQRHAASYDSIRPGSLAAALNIHHLYLTEDNAADRREADEERYDLRVASKLLTMGEWSLGLNLESTNVNVSAPIQKRNDVRLYGLNPWVSFQLSPFVTFAYQQNLTIINQEDESFDGEVDRSSRHVRQGVASIAFHPEAGTELGLSIADGYKKAINGVDIQKADRYSIFGSTRNLLPALVGFEVAVLNFHAVDTDLHDAYSLELFSEVPLGSAFTLDSAIGYQTAAFHKASTLNAETAAHGSLEVGGRYQLSESLNLGAALAVDTAVGEKDGTYVDQKDWSLQLQTQLAL